LRILLALRTLPAILRPIGRSDNAGRCPALIH
jgi:hypothetical protein